MQHHLICVFVLLLSLLQACGGSTPASSNGGTNNNPSANPSTNPFDNSKSSVGMNLIWITEWESMMPFINTFKKSRPWTVGQGTLSLDENGWVRSLQPGQIAITVLMSGNISSQQALGNKFPSGDYIVTYEGEGTLNFTGSAVSGIQNPSTGRYIVSLNFSNATASFSIQLTSTNTINYLKNIKVILPGGVCNHDPFHYAANAQACTDQGLSYESNESIESEFVFYAPFLNNLKYFKAIRFLQALNINGSSVRNVADLRSPSYATYWQQLPIEVMIAMANRLNVDIWFNVPHLASDAYVEHVASLMRNDLNSNLKVYVEFTNEIWNGNQPYSEHAQYLAATGCPLYSDLTGCDQDATPNNGVLCEGYPWPNSNANCTTARNRYFSDRTVEIGQIFRDVFGNGDRVVRVMGAWNQSTYNRALLDHNSNYQRVDAVAFATYFGGYIPSNLNNADILQAWLNQGGQQHALNLLFQEILQGGAMRPYYMQGGQYYNPALAVWELPPATGSVNAMIENARDIIELIHSYGLSAVSYEGGPHLDVTVNSNSTEVRDLMLTANRDPRMADAFRLLLEGWKNAGGDLLMLYVNISSSSGFGMLDYELQPHAEQPKFEAVQQFIENHDCWWQGC